MSLTSKHDKFIRAILADKEIAIDYFRTALPAYIVERLDFSTLTQLPDTYVSNELRKTVSDIVYSCSLKNGSGTIKISLLIEHKSYIDKHTPIQVGAYIFSGLLKQISNKEKRLALIIPIILYHGKEKWEYRTLIDLFPGLDPELKHFVPNYNYIYHNLGEISDAQIQVLNNKFLAASLLALKYSLLKDELKYWLPTILTLALEKAKHTLQNNIIIYTFESSGFNEEHLRAIIEQLPAKTKDTMLSTLDMLLEKGRKEEREKTVRNLIKISNLSNEQIASATDLPVDYVARIREELKN